MFTLRKKKTSNKKTTQTTKRKKMTQIEQIKSEIERRRVKYKELISKSFGVEQEYFKGMAVVADEMMLFINSLPEKPSEDLEEAANIYANKQGLELKPFARRFFIAGANWQKEQLMKSATNGCYIKRNKYTKQNVLNGLSVTCEAIQKFKDGDKVKVIIVKEAEQ